MKNVNTIKKKPINWIKCNVLWTLELHYACISLNPLEAAATLILINSALFLFITSCLPALTKEHPQILRGGSCCCHTISAVGSRPLKGCRKAFHFVNIAHDTLDESKDLEGHRRTRWMCPPGGSKALRNEAAFREQSWRRSESSGSTPDQQNIRSG